MVVAQYKGSGNDRMVSQATAASVASVSLIALGIGLLLMGFHTPILNLLFGTASPEVLDNARIYLIGSSISYLGIAVVQAVCGALRGVGKTRASLMLSLIMNLLYVILNVVFINLLHMGVLGMTLAINIARYAGMVCALVYLFKVDTALRVRFRDLFRIPLTMLRRIMFIGVPFAAEQMFFNGETAHSGVYCQPRHLCHCDQCHCRLAGSGVSNSSQRAVAYYCNGGRPMYWAGNVSEARKFIKSFLWIGSGSLALIALILMPLFHPLVSIFSPPSEIIDDLFVVLLVNSIAQVPLWAISFILPSALRAAGDSRFTSITSMLTMWLFRVIFGYILGIVLGYGVMGVWLAMNCEWAVRGGIFLWRFRGEKWFAHKLI